MKKNQIPLPCFLLEEAKLIRNLELIRSVKNAAGIDIILAFKAFSMWHSFPLIKQYLDGATASSLWEALLCAEGLETKAHTYSPAYLPEDIEQLGSCSSHLTFNSISEYDRYAAQLRQQAVSLGLRVNPEYSTVATDLYNPASKGSRLGVTAKELKKKGLPKFIEGLHFHSLCESSAQDLVDTLAAFEKRFAAFLPKLKWVNMGGGHLMTGKDYDIELLIKTLKSFRKKYNVKVILEPGSAIAWETGDLHCRVLDIVKSHGTQTAILDVSFTAHMPDTLEMPYRPVIEGANKDGKGKFSYRLGGVSCLAGDFLGEYGFDKKIKPGDELILKDMMHYTMVKTTMFNGVKHPSIACLKKDGNLEVWRTFTYDDFKSRLG